MELRRIGGPVSLPKTYSIIVPGNFDGSGYTDLLCYDPTGRRGVGHFYRTDGKGTISQIRAYTNWRPTWTQILPGNFGGDEQTDLFYYDSTRRDLEFYIVSGNAKIRQICDTITVLQNVIYTVGDFGGSGFSDVLSYSPATGQVQVSITNGTGGLVGKLPQALATGWTHVIAGKFSDNAYTDVMFYNSSKGDSAFYTTDGSGALTLLKSQTGGPTGRLLITPGIFGATSYTDLLFYNSDAGTGTFFATDGKGNLVLLHEPFEGWRKTLTHIVAGNFGGPTTDLFFYDPAAGEGEFCALENLPVTIMPWYSNWTNRENGRVVGEPTAIWRTPEVMDTFVRSNDNGLWQNSWDGSKWTGWTPHNDGFTLGGSPVVASEDANHLFLFAANDKNILFQKTWTKGSGWSQWENRDQGVVIGEPAAVFTEPGVCELFIRSQDNHLWTNVWHASRSRWTLWQPLNDGFVAGSSPVALATGPNTMMLFACDDKGIIYYKMRSNGFWTGWSSLYPGRTKGKPIVVIASGGALHALVQAIDRTLWHAAMKPNGTWGTWHSLADPVLLASSPIAVSHPNDRGRVDIFAVDTALGVICQKTWSL